MNLLTSSTPTERTERRSITKAPNNTYLSSKDAPSRGPHTPARSARNSPEPPIPKTSNQPSPLSPMPRNGTTPQGDTQPEGFCILAASKMPGLAPRRLQLSSCPYASTNPRIEPTPAICQGAGSRRAYLKKSKRQLQVKSVHVAAARRWSRLVKVTRLQPLPTAQRLAAIFCLQASVIILTKFSSPIFSV